MHSLRCGWLADEQFYGVRQTLSFVLVNDGRDARRDGEIARTIKIRDKLRAQLFTPTDVFIRLLPS